MTLTAECARLLLCGATLALKIRPPRLPSPGAFFFGGAGVKGIAAKQNPTIEQWPTTRPIPYARNARVIPDSAVGKVAASIKEFGFKNPIIVDGMIESSTQVSPHCANSRGRDTRT